MIILMIGPFPDPVTGESIANKQFLDYLHAQNHEVQVIDMSLNSISSQQGIFSFSKFFSSLGKYIAIYKIFLSDVLYITPGQTFLGVLKYAPFILISRVFRRKIVLHIHGGGLRYTVDESKGLRKYILVKLLKCTDAGIVLSKSLRDNFKGILPINKIYDVSNFASKDILSLNFEHKNYDSLKVLYLSNLMVEKGILDVIDAADQLNLTGKYYFKIAGNIESSNYNLIKSKLESSTVKYMGSVQGENKLQLLRECNVLILPTFYKTEGQPISIIEAMASGMYIVTTRHSGIPDLIKEGVNGSFVKKHSSQSIVDEIQKLSKNLEVIKSIGMKNRKEVMIKYHPDRFGKELLDILKDVFVL